MIAELLITSTVMILGIFGLRKLTMGKISMRLRYALWLLVAVRLLVPVSVGTSVCSVMNLLPQTMREDGWRLSAGGGTEKTPAGEPYNTISGGQNTDVETAEGQMGQGIGILSATHEETGLKEPFTEDGRQGKGGVATKAAGAAPDGFTAVGILGTIWLLGFLAVGGYMVISKWRFLVYLRQNRRAFPAEAVPQEFAERFLRRGIKVYQVKGLPGPCLAGRHIYMGEDAVRQNDLTHILAHEYGHALHGDGLWAFLRCVLAAVYWFDPFVWAAVYAARRDSELACDETAVRLLGDESRFAYGRTILALLEGGDGRRRCPGLTFMTQGGESGVGERIKALAEKRRTKKPVLAATLAAVVLICGCAFTGAEEETENEERQSETAAVPNGTEQTSDAQERQTVNEENNEEFARIQKEYEEALENGKLTKFSAVGVGTKILSEEEAKQAAFEEALNYHGVMEGKDDSELSLKREADYQTYYQYTKGEAENPMENGWYLLCENKEAGIALYGLYTEEFGFRGLKTLIGEDVNTFDGTWCASLLNSGDNIRVLEQAEGGLPRRFVWKLPAQESGTVEIWRFYYANRYDTGTVDMKMLSEEDCLAWAKEHLSFTIDQEEAKVYVTYDEDMALGEIDISAYRDFETEEVRIVPEVLGFSLDDPGADLYAAYSDAVWEALAAHLAVGLKFAGVEGLWFDGLPLLTVQIAEDENSASGFRLDYPRIDETYAAAAPWQEKKLSELQEGISPSQTDSFSAAGQDDLKEPLINEGEGHHDLAIDFSNPCPDFDRISDVYGERIHPVTQDVRTHTGVDLAAPAGADILAAADGTVFMTGFDAVNGNYVVLWHGQSGQMTYYAHCKTVEAAKGQEVKQGEKIATVGQTGMATGPFLHFAVSYENNWEEPYFLDLE